MEGEREGGREGGREREGGRGRERGREEGGRLKTTCMLRIRRELSFTLLVPALTNSHSSEDKKTRHNPLWVR